MTEQHSWKQEEDKEGIAMKFENKVAIITGSTRGIGRATAELFAKEGAKVIVVGTKEELGESCVNAIKAAGGEAIFCKTDVTSDESLDNLVKTALDAYGKIDILVNNAGVGGTTADMDQITMDEWNTVLATNLTSALDGVTDVVHVVGLPLFEVLEHICKRTGRFQERLALLIG